MRCLPASVVFAIRWREVFDILFVGAITWFCRYALPCVSKAQNDLIARAVRAAEEAVASARRSAEIAEAAIKNFEPYETPESIKRKSLAHTYIKS